MATQITTMEGSKKTLQKGQLEEFTGNLRGYVLTPDDPRFGDRPIYNKMQQCHPGLIVRCWGAADIADAVKFARANDLLVAVRGGGHSVAGHSTCDGGMVIDLSEMRGVDVDPDAQIARVQGGALWKDLDRETQLFGQVVPGGVVSETGVAGLTLGGGQGWVRRKYGLTIDSLLSARVVCADGSVRTASPESEPDLFWAIRGGGGNFGVVTSFEFRTHPLGPMVAFAATFYPLEDAEKILPLWRDYCESCPDEVTSSAIAISLPAAPMLPEAVHNKACLFVGGLYVGGPDNGMKRLQPLRQLGTPLADISQPMPFTFIQSAFDPFFPLGRLQSYWKAQYLDSLSDDAIQVIASRAKTRPHPITLVNTFHMGGAINRISPTDTAFSERSANWMSSIDGNWEDPGENKKNIAWVREGFDQIGKFGNGATYSNFMGQADETAQGLTAKAYGANLDKLRKIKSEYDPDNFFRSNLNIRPA